MPTPQLRLRWCATNGRVCPAGVVSVTTAVGGQEGVRASFRSGRSCGLAYGGRASVGVIGWGWVSPARRRCCGQPRTVAA